MGFGAAEPSGEPSARIAEAIQDLLREADARHAASDAAWPVFEAEFKGEDQRVALTPYRPLDLFAVLAYHYPPEQDEQTGRRVELLAAVLDSDYLQLTNRTAISTEMVLLKETIRSDLAERGSISYQQRVRDKTESRALRWAAEIWRRYERKDPNAAEFLEALLPESILEEFLKPPDEYGPDA